MSRIRSLFGPWIRTQRNLLGLTEAQFATRVGCSAALVRDVECNTRPIPGEFLRSWAESLLIQPEVLIAHYLNQEARRMCLEAHVEQLWQLTPVSWEESGYECRN